MSPVEHVAGTAERREPAQRQGPSNVGRLPLALALLAGAALWAWIATLLWNRTVPGSVHLPHLDASRYFGESFLHRSATYERFLAIDQILAALVVIAVLAVYARHCRGFMRESAAGRVGTGLLLGMLGFCFAWLAQLPFGLAAVWWQRRYGVSHQGYLEWAFNSFFSLGVEFVFLSFGLAIAMGLAGALRRWWWLVAAPIFVAIGLLFTFVSPYLIPGTSSLDRPGLVADAGALARKEGVDTPKLRVQEVHRATTAPNAESTGFGPTSTIILWDTLLDGRFSRSEIRVVLAHELGHLAHDDALRRVGWLALFLIPAWGLVALLSRRRGGFARPEAVPIALLVLVALQLLVSPLFNVISRRDEAAADWAALQATHDPGSDRSLMIGLAETSLSNPDPPSWSYALFEDHPTIMQRIAMAQAWEEWSRRQASR